MRRTLAIFLGEHVKTRRPSRNSAFIPPKHLILRHVFLALTFVVFYLLLSRPEVIFVARLGFVAWYPATGLVLASMLGISPWYAFLAVLCDTLSGALFYHQPLKSLTESISAVGTATCYAGAALLLRGPLSIDSKLRQQQDMLRYLLVTVVVAMLATVGAGTSLVLSGAILKSECWASALGGSAGTALDC